MEPTKRRVLKVSGKYVTLLFVTKDLLCGSALSPSNWGLSFSSNSKPLVPARKEIKEGGKTGRNGVRKGKKRGKTLQNCEEDNYFVDLLITHSREHRMERITATVHTIIEELSFTPFQCYRLRLSIPILLIGYGPNHYEDLERDQKPIQMINGVHIPPLMV